MNIITHVTKQLEEGCKAGSYCPNIVELQDIYNLLPAVLFPLTKFTQLQRAANIQQIHDHLISLLECQPCNCDETKPSLLRKVSTILESLPNIQSLVQSDIEAAIQNDPATSDSFEVQVAYPSFKAVLTQRFAHVLYTHSVPLLPRLLTEMAHSETGIDIHPGASIGTDFFIDHGTGVVIGESTIIGNSVTLYQGVTLGGLSFKHDEHGAVIREEKRHPTIEDGVTIYANATILGGNTIIGTNAIIGANAFVTNSVKPNTKVWYVASDRQKG